MPFFQGQVVAIGSGSTSTSAWWYVGDFRSLAASWNSSASLGPSRFTVWVSNDNGLNAVLPNASQSTNASVLTGVNMIGNTPGNATLLSGNERFRWARVTVAPANHSVASAGTITLTGWSY
jgi:hypothetical protein